MADRKRMKKSGLNYVLLALLALVTLGCLGVFGWFMFRSHRKVVRYNEAVRAMETGDSSLAKLLLLETIREDRNHEAAIVKLAELLEQEGDWQGAAQLWRRASGLNAFQTEYVGRYQQALLRSGGYEQLLNALERQKQKSALTPEQTVIFAFVTLKSGKAAAAGELIDSVPGEKSPLAVLVRFYLNREKLPRTELLRKLEELTSSEDPVVAFDVCETIARVRSTLGDTEGAEKFRRAAANANPRLGEPQLGDFYLQNGKFEQAAEVFRSMLKRGPDPVTAVKLGEALAAHNKLDQLKALSEQYRIGNKPMLQAGYYLDSLTAFLEKDPKRLAANLKLVDGVVRTPVARMIGLYSAIGTRDLPEVEKQLTALRDGAVPATIRERAGAMALPCIAELVRENRIEDATRLARLVQGWMKPELLLLRLITADDLRQGRLGSAEVKQALGAFPKDPVLLNAAAARALQQGEFAAALELAERNRTAGGNNPGILFQLLAAREGLGKLDEVSAEFGAARRKQPEDTALADLYLSFCVRNRRAGELKQLAEELRQAKTPELRVLALAAEAELALLKQDSAAAEKLLREAIAAAPSLPRLYLRLAEAQEAAGKNKEAAATLETGLKAIPADVELAYRAARLHALADDLEPAIRLYSRIADRYPDPELIRVNLSELYAAAGRSAEALKTAESAWLAKPDWPPAQECYGIRLTETGAFDRAVPVLDRRLLAAGKPELRVIQAWRTAMEGLIRQQFETKEYSACLNSCRKLSERIPNSPLAVEFREKAEKLIKK